MQVCVIILLGALFLLSIGSPCPVIATPPDNSALKAAITDLEAGQRVRLLTDVGQEIDGHWRGSAADSIYLEISDSDSPAAIAHTDVVGIWSRGRATHAGAKTLGITGAAVGGAFGILGGLYAAGISGDDDDAVMLKVALVGLLFAGAGGVIGAATGSAIGAALPRWHPVYSQDPDPAQASPAPVAAPPGQPLQQGPQARFCLVGGYARGLEKRAQGSPGVRVALLTDLSRHLTIGPELGYAATGYHPVIPGLAGTEVITVSDAFHAGAALHYIPFRARLSPYLAAGLGLYVRDDQYLGYSLGGGLEFNGESDGPRVSLDFRFHDSTTPQPGSAHLDGVWPAYFTAGLGISF